MLQSYGSVELEIPSKMVVLPDGQSSLTTMRTPRGTLTMSSRAVSRDGNKIIWEAKPQFRWDSMLAGTLRGEAQFLPNPDRIISRILTVSGKPFDDEPVVAYKEGTREAAKIQNLWKSSDSWYVPGQKYPRPIRNLDRGEKVVAGEGITGTFVVTNPRGLLGTLELDHRDYTVVSGGYRLSILGADLIPYHFKVGDTVVLKADAPVISSKPTQLLNGKRIFLSGTPFNPREIRPQRP